MKEKIINIFENIGLVEVKAVSPLSYNYSDYKDVKNLSEDKLIQHRDFLKSLIDEENSRLENIEGKTTQLISQTSLIISLASLFIPLLIDKSDDLIFWIKVLFVFILIFTYVFYILTIINALKNYNVIKYNYSSPNPENVLIFKDKSTIELNEELVRDYLYSIKENQNLNNIKATNVLHSYNTFKIANISLSVLIISVCLISFFKKNENEKIEIMNPIKLKLSDPVKIENRIFKKPIYIIQRDTIYVKR